MRFTKMHGAGNDFLIFDPARSRARTFRHSPVAPATGTLGSGRTGSSSPPPPGAPTWDGLPELRRLVLGDVRQRTALPGPLRQGPRDRDADA
jgi:hypothetical protein